MRAREQKLHATVRGSRDGPESRAPGAARGVATRTFLATADVLQTISLSDDYVDGSPSYIRFPGEGDYGVLFQAGIKGSF